MAVTSWSLHWNGATGNRSRDGGREYTAVYRLRTNDWRDQAQVVIDYFLANVLPFGSVYSYSNDYDPFAILQSVRPSRDLNSRNEWLLTCTFSPLEEPENEDPDGEPSTDPLDWRARITSSTVQYSVPVERATFKGGFNSDALAMVPVDTRIIPLNSAMQPFNPGLEKESSRTVINIQRNVATWSQDDADAIENHVNSMGFSINYLGFTKTVVTNSARIRGSSATFRRTNGIDYWDGSCTLDISNEPLGWWDEVVDRGVAARAAVGDPDGRGGSISGQSTAAGVPHARRLVDADETPLSDPVLLDGNGQPLTITKGAPVEPVYLWWEKYDPVDFRLWSFLAPLIT